MDPRRAGATTGSSAEAAAATGGTSNQKGYMQLIFELSTSTGFKVPQYVLVALLAVRWAQTIGMGFIAAAASSESRWIGLVANWLSYMSLTRADVMHGSQAYFGALLAAVSWASILLGLLLVHYTMITRYVKTKLHAPGAIHLSRSQGCWRRTQTCRC